MSELHTQIASDEYWQRPETTRRSPNLVLRVLDAYHSEDAPAKILHAYHHLVHHGYGATNLASGARTPIPRRPGELLRVVEDARRELTSPFEGEVVTAADFNRVAGHMAAHPLFNQDPVRTVVEGPRGPVLVGRRVIYYAASATGSQLVGSEAHLVRRATAELVPRRVIGEAWRYRHRRRSSLVKQVAATLLTPAGEPEPSALAKTMRELGELYLPARNQA